LRIVSGSEENRNVQTGLIGIFAVF